MMKSKRIGIAMERVVTAHVACLGRSGYFPAGRGSDAATVGCDWGIVP